MVNSKRKEPVKFMKTFMYLIILAVQFTVIMQVLGALLSYALNRFAKAVEKHCYKQKN